MQVLAFLWLWYILVVVYDEKHAVCPYLVKKEFTKHRVVDIDFVVSYCHFYHIFEKVWSDKLVCTCANNILQFNYFIIRLGWSYFKSDFFFQCRKLLYNNYRFYDTCMHICLVVIWGFYLILKSLKTDTICRVNV